MVDGLDEEELCDGYQDLQISHFSAFGMGLLQENYVPGKESKRDLQCKL